MSARDRDGSVGRVSFALGFDVGWGPWLKGLAWSGWSGCLNFLDLGYVFLCLSFHPSLLFLISMDVLRTKI